MSLIVHDVALEAITAIGPVAATIARRDSKLADQLRRAAASIVLNISEGARSEKRTKTTRYHSAAGSASETRSALRIAAAWGYIEPRTAQSIDKKLDRVCAMLWGLTHGRTTT